MNRTTTTDPARYWQQRCAKAECELEHILETNHRKGVWIELAWHVLDQGETSPEEIDYLMDQFKEIAQDVT